MKIVKAKSLSLFLTLLLVGKANADFKFVHHDEEGNEGRNLKEGSGWGTFGYSPFCMEPVKKELGSKLVLSNCTDSPTRNQQFRFTATEDAGVPEYRGKLQWRRKRNWCVDVKDSDKKRGLKGGKPLILTKCRKQGITEWLTDTDKTWPFEKQHLCIYPRTEEIGAVIEIINCEKYGGSFDFFADE